MAKMLRAGTLNKQIVIQRAAEIEATDNSITLAWSNLKQTRAAITPIKGDEFFINQNLVNDVDHYIIMRKSNFDIVPKDRIIYKERVFDIVYNINVDERGVESMMLVKERIGEAVVFEECEMLLEDGVTTFLTESGEVILIDGGC